MKPLIGSAAVLAALVSARPMIDHASGLDAFRAYPHRDTGFKAIRKGDLAVAIDAFERALAMDPDDEQSARGLIAALLARSDLARAAQLAEQQLAEAPDDPLMLATVALARAPDKPLAIRALIAQQPVASGEAVPAQPLPAAVATMQLAKAEAPAAERMFALLEPAAGPEPRIALPASARRWQTSAYLMSRANEPDRLRAGRPVPGLGGSQMVAGASYRVAGSPSQPVEVGVRLATALADRPGASAWASAQMAAGVSFRPLSGVNLVVAGERLIAAGRDSRDAWMLRTAWSAGPGPVSGGIGWSLDAQAAVIGARQRDLFAGADIRVGRKFHLGSAISVAPYVGISALAQQAETSASLIEAAPGLAFQLRPVAGLQPVTVRLDWRQRLAGTAGSANGLTVTIGAQF